MVGKITLLCLLIGLIALPQNSHADMLSDKCKDDNKSKVHNYFFGQRQYNDKMVFMDNPHVKSKFMRVQSEDVVYPPKGEMPQGTITYIEILDQRSDGTGGCAYIENGGVGNNFVKLHIKSQRNHGYDFTIRVYTR